MGSFYSRLQEAYGPGAAVTSGVIGAAGEILMKNGTLATDPTEQLARWQEHFTDLFNQEGDSTLDDMPAWTLPRQSATAHGLDAIITKEEMQEALDKSKFGKATGIDSVPIEVDRCMSSETYKEYLLQLLNAILDTGGVPQDWKDVVITVLHKSGDTRDCNNYRGISLMSHLGKTFERIMAKRLLTHMLKTPLRYNLVWVPAGRDG
jgi:hypothetical protein